MHPQVVQNASCASQKNLRSKQTNQELVVERVLRARTGGGLPIESLTLIVFQRVAPSSRYAEGRRPTQTHCPFRLSFSAFVSFIAFCLRAVSQQGSY